MYSSGNHEHKHKKILCLHATLISILYRNTNVIALALGIGNIIGTLYRFTPGIEIRNDEKDEGLGNVIWKHVHQSNEKSMHGM